MSPLRYILNVISLLERQSKYCFFAGKSCSNCRFFSFFVLFLSQHGGEEQRLSLGPVVSLGDAPVRGVLLQVLDYLIM